MATTPTTKLGIPLPVAGSNEPFTVAAYNFGINSLDAAAGATVVTSITRPGSPWVGQIIHETDTDKTLVWDGVAWVETGTAVEDLDDLGDVTITTPVAGEKLVFDGTNWVNLEGYVFVETVYFTSNDTFTKASYPWLRAIRVRMVGGGGGSGGNTATSSNAVSVGMAGGGAGYCEKFITNIAGLSASETITRGAGGAAGAAGNNNGSDGGNSTAFGLTAGGGKAGNGDGTLSPADSFPFSAGGGSASGGDINIQGANAHMHVALNNVRVIPGMGGASQLSGGVTASSVAFNGSGEKLAIAGKLYGGGASGPAKGYSSATNRAGAAGGNGIVIVELYA
jgi:hypothetical protein